MSESIELIEEVRIRFDYDSVTGHLIYKTGFRAGKVALGAACSKGYRQLKIDGKSYMVHRLVWIWVKRAIPSGQIDHKFGDKDDTRIENLRDVNGHFNQQNRTKAMTTNRSSGVLGVHKYRRRWAAHIRVGGHVGKLHRVGVFDTIEEAGAAYLEAKKRLHPGSVL